jgi:hypothetical protein
LSCASQTALTQTRAPAAIVHVPFRVGLVCAESVATATPFTSFGEQVCEVSLHQSPMEAQSASTLHPLGAPQTPLIVQTPERQTVPPVAIVQVPSPFA